MVAHKCLHYNTITPFSDGHGRFIGITGRMIQSLMITGFMVKTRIKYVYIAPEYIVYD